MSPKVLVAFLLGCVSGGIVVAIVTAAHTRGGEATAAAESPSSSKQPRPVVESWPRPSEPVVKPEGNSVVAAAARKPGESASASPQDKTSTPGYDFAKVVRTAQQLDDIFRAEKVDSAWASQTVDSFNMALSQMPERSVIGDYAFTCKESLCKLEIRGDVKLLAGADSRVQPALMKLMHDPPAGDIFDDSTMQLDSEPDGSAIITIYAHRRKQK